MTTHALRLRGARVPPAERTPYGRYLLASVGLMAIAAGNGIVRELTYANAMSEDAAHWLALLPMTAFFALYVWWLEGRWPLPTRRAALTVGVAWAAIAVGFELAVGRGVDGKGWSELLAAYNLVRGGSGGAVLLVAALAPVAVWHLRRAR